MPTASKSRRVIRVLYVTGASVSRKPVLEALTADSGFRVTRVTARQEFDNELAEGGIDVVLSDSDGLGFENTQVIDFARLKCPGLPIIVLDGAGSIEAAVDAMRRGASDYVAVTPSGIRDLPSRIRSALERPGPGQERTGVTLAEVDSRENENENELRSAINKMDDLVFLLNEHGVFTGYLQSLVRPDLYAPPEAFLGKPFEEVLPPDVARLLGDASDRLAAGGPSQRFEYSLDIADETRWFSATVSVRDCDGQFVGVTVVARNITERKLAESALKESEARYRLLAENAKDVIWTSELDLRMTYVSPSVESLRGFTASEAEAQSLDENLTPASVELAMQALAEELAAVEDTSHVTSRVRTLELEQLCKDGSTVWAEAKMSFLVGDDGRPVGILGVSRDISERKHVEETLRRSEKELQRLFDEAPVGYHELNSEGCIARANQTELHMLGYAADEMIGRPVWEFSGSPKDVRKAVRAKLSGAVPTGGPFERFYRCKDGTLLPVLIEDRLLRDANGQITGIRSTIQDITERKRAEEAIRAKNKQLLQKQKLEAVGSLAGGIAHEFNNLLQVIQGYTQFVLEDLSPSDQRRQDLQRVVEAADTAAKLTSQLLNFSRRDTLGLEDVNPNDMVRELVKLLHPLIGERIQLEVSVSEQVSDVHADRALLQQALMNLCLNARDAMPSGGKLTIKTETSVLDETFAERDSELRPGSYVQITVTDTGCGMSPEIMQRAFEPFFTTTDVGEGTGLGLAMVYGVVQQHEGTVHVSSEPGSGTTFRVYLPAFSGRSAPKEPPEILPAREGNETILVAEDEPLVREVVVRILRGAGYSTLAAEDGEQAVGLVAQHGARISLALLDAVMPRMNGREAYRQIMRLNPEMKVIFCTGYDATSGQTDLADVGDLPVMGKPFRMDVLLRLIRTVLDSTSDAAR